MVDYTDDDAVRAEAIVRSLLDGDGDVILEANLVVSDLEADAAEFAAELVFLESISANVPAIRLEGEELIPVALSLFATTGLFGFPSGFLPLSLSRWWKVHPLLQDLWHIYFRSLSEPGGLFDGFDTMSREQARSTFLRRGTDFLATRIASVREFEGPESRQQATVSFLNIRQRARGPQVLTPGCFFTVSTNSSGLRVFWSGVFRITLNYFSHPTTPATSVLQSGRYVFGVDGGAYGNNIQWDTSAVITLPGNAHVHLNY